MVPGNHQDAAVCAAYLVMWCFRIKATDGFWSTLIHLWKDEITAFIDPLSLFTSSLAISHNLIFEVYDCLPFFFSQFWNYIHKRHYLG